MYFTKKNLIGGLLAVFLMVFGFSIFTNKADAQFIYSTNTPNNPSSYAYYRQICPIDFTLTVYNINQYMCYKIFGGGQVLGASTTNYNYNPISSSLIPGCLPGYIYSELTGQRCSGNYYYNSNLNGGEGDISKFDIRDGNDINPQEGDNDAEIMEVRFDADNSDIRLDRIEFDFEFTGNSNGEDMPWHIFDEIRLLSDGVEIAQMDSDSRSDWDEEDNDTYSISFSSLDEIIRENDRANLTLEVDINSDITVVNNNDTSWDIYIPDDGLRARDGNGNAIYAGNDSDSVSINIEEN